MKITVDNKCPSCGANVKFNPTTQKWDCEYCGNSYEIGEFEKQQEKETKENLDFEIDEYTCPNCGATVVTDANTVATHCVYCGNTTIMKNRLQGEFKPDKLIPFKTTKEEAIEEFKKNVKKRWFAPSDFHDEKNIEKICLCHIDSVADNFLIFKENGIDKVRLIDFEYAGMQDPDVDIAMFCIYSMLDRKQIDNLIDIYYEENCKPNIRIKIYCYIAACGLLWSNWCEYKKILGIEFGEYSLKQYRYAKEYYKIAINEMEKLK